MCLAILTSLILASSIIFILIFNLSFQLLICCCNSLVVVVVTFAHKLQSNTLWVVGVCVWTCVYVCVRMRVTNNILYTHTLRALLMCPRTTYNVPHYVCMYVYGVCSASSRLALPRPSARNLSRTHWARPSSSEDKDEQHSFLLGERTTHVKHTLKTERYRTISNRAVRVI